MIGSGGLAFMAEDSRKQSRNRLLFREIQVSMTNASGFHLHKNFVISEVVIDVDLLIAKWSAGLANQQCFRNHRGEDKNKEIIKFDRISLKVC